MDVTVECTGQEVVNAGKGEDTVKEASEVCYREWLSSMPFCTSFVSSSAGWVSTDDNYQNDVFEISFIMFDGENQFNIDHKIHEREDAYEALEAMDRIRRALDFLERRMKESGFGREENTADEPPAGTKEPGGGTKGSPSGESVSKVSG
jgi:hypothetical protein